MTKKPWAVLSDVEGVLKNGAFDGAKKTVNILVERKLMTEAERDLVQGKFDEHDDNRYRNERFLWSFYNIGGTRRWSTGTLPGIAICYAARGGLKQEEIFDLTRAGDDPTPGANEFLLETKEKGIPVYLLTSAEASVALRLGKEMGISSSRIYSMGYRPSAEKITEYDKNPNPEAEAEERSVLKRLLPYRKELEQFLPRFVANGVAWEDAFENGKHDARMKAERDWYALLHSNDYPLEFLVRVRDLFLRQGVLMGSHQKAEVVHEMATYLDGPYRPILIGDSIVDADAALCAGAHGGYGVAVNSTSDDLNYAANLLLATTDMRAMNSLRDGITAGKLSPVYINEGSAEYVTKLFTPTTFRNNPELVSSAMKSCKSAVKDLYRG